MFDADKTKMIGLLTVWRKNYDNILSRFHLIPEPHGRTDGWTDRQTDRFAMSMSRISTLMSDKNHLISMKFCTQQQILNWMNLA